jgi:hypothetical protein
MANVNVLEWGMHAAGTNLQFAARRLEDCYNVTIKKDDALVVTYSVADGSSVLEKSRMLRKQLERLGFTPTLATGDEPAFGGSIYWGPAQPLDSSLAEVLLS